MRLFDIPTELDYVTGGVTSKVNKRETGNFEGYLDGSALKNWLINLRAHIINKISILIPIYVTSDFDLSVRAFKTYLGVYIRWYRYKVFPHCAIACKARHSRSVTSLQQCATLCAFVQPRPCF